jgi:hypothetical protein
MGGQGRGGGSRALCGWILGRGVTTVAHEHDELAMVAVAHFSALAWREQEREVEAKVEATATSWRS